MNDETQQKVLKGFVTEEGVEKIEYSFSRKTAMFDERTRKREGYTFGGSDSDKIRASAATIQAFDKLVEEQAADLEKDHPKHPVPEASFDDMPSLHHLESTSDFGIFKIVQAKKAELDSSLSSPRAEHLRATLQERRLQRREEVQDHGTDLEAEELVALTHQSFLWSNSPQLADQQRTQRPPEPDGLLADLRSLQRRVHNEAADHAVLEKQREAASDIFDERTRVQQAQQRVQHNLRRTLHETPNRLFG